MILQDPMASLNPLFTIGDQVGEPIRVHEGASRATAWSRAKELLKAVRIPSPETRVTQYPHEMSGGMRQRIVGAIGISCEPRLLIADEPTTSLDLTIQAQYLNLLRELQREHDLALIFITHNLGIVAKMCDQLAVMYAGRVVESGPVSQIFNSPAHPYTEALLNSIPRMSDTDQRLIAIDGQPPDLSAAAAGLLLRRRAVPRAFDRCRDAAPPEIQRRRRAGRRAAGSRPLRRSRPAGAAAERLMAVLEAGGAQQAFPGEARDLSAAIAASCARSTASRSRSSAGRRSGSSAKVRLRQDDDGKARARPGRADRRRDPLRGRGPAGARHGRAPALPQIGPGGLPGSRTPRSTRACGSARSSPSRSSPTRRLPASEVRQRVLRSCSTSSGLPERAADLFPHEFSGGQRQRIAIARALALSPQLDRARRAGLRARRVDPRADPQPVARPAGRARALLPVHRPRPRRGRAYEPHDRGHVSRQDRRERRGPDARARAEASLHRGAVLGGVAEPPRRARARRSSCPARCRARSTRHRAAASTRAAATRWRAAAPPSRCSPPSRAARSPATCSKRPSPRSSAPRPGRQPFPAPHRRRP